MVGIGKDASLSTFGAASEELEGRARYSAAKEAGVPAKWVAPRKSASVP